MKYYLIYFLLILLSPVILTACSSIITAGTAAFITTTWYDSRTIGSQLDDNILKIYIYHALNNNKEIKKFTRILNIVYQGNVLLIGQSPYIKLSETAIKIIKNINGVKNIYNAIRNTQPISFQNILLDSLISNQIRFHLFTQKNTHLSKIKVISENKEVFLLGQVTYKEGCCAEEIAKNTKGVKNVFTIFLLPTTK